MTNIDNIKSLINKNSDDCFVGKGASQELIRAFEKEMGVVFPPSYACFLRNFGTLIFAGEEFYGITPKGLNSMSAPCVFFVTRALQSRGDASSNMVVVSVSGDGLSYCIDYDVDGGCGEPAIVEVGLEYKRTKYKSVVSKNFGEFIEEKIKEAIR